MKKYFSSWSPIKMQLLQLSMMIVVILHVDACALYLIARLSDFPDDSWVALTGIEDLPADEQYVWALFTTISHMSCISYGAFNPARTIEAAFVSFSNLVGAITYTSAVGSIAALVMSENRAGSNFREFSEEMELVSRIWGRSVSS